MDRALKERVIGAIALVAIAILVVPVFLDGPATEAEIISEAVTLPGQNEQARKRQTIVLERDRDQPVPVSASRNTQAMTPAEKLAADDAARKAAAAEEAAAKEAAAAEALAAQAKTDVAETGPPPAAKDASAAEKKPSAAKTTVAKADDAPAAKPAATGSAAESSTGMWAVQLGSFSNEANAERLAADLRKNGYAAFLSQHKSSSGSLHRVRVGPQKDRESAEAVASKLGGDGHKGQVVPHP
jgi:DedD protein